MHPSTVAHVVSSSSPLVSLRFGFAPSTNNSITFPHYSFISNKYFSTIHHRWAWLNRWQCNYAPMFLFIVDTRIIDHKRDWVPTFCIMQAVELLPNTPTLTIHSRAPPSTLNPNGLFSIPGTQLGYKNEEHIKKKDWSTVKIIKVYIYFNYKNMVEFSLNYLRKFYKF